MKKRMTKTAFSIVLSIAIFCSSLCIYGEEYDSDSYYQRLMLLQSDACEAARQLFLFYEEMMDTFSLPRIPIFLKQDSL